MQSNTVRLYVFVGYWIALALTQRLGFGLAPPKKERP